MTIDVGRRRPRPRTASSISAAVLDPHDLDGRRRRAAPTVVTRVTLAPRAAASSARAWPCLPDERLPMKRTGSIGSRVPPAVTSTRRPGEVAAAPSTRLDGGDDRLGLGQAAGADVAAGEAPLLGRARRARPGATRVARLSCTAGCSHISVCMAGRHDHRRPGGEQRGREQVVRDAGGVAADEPGRGRGHDDDVGATGRAGCAGSGRRRRTATCGPARTPAPRTWSRRRSGWRPGSAPATTWAPASTRRRQTSIAL